MGNIIVTICGKCNLIQHDEAFLKNGLVFKHANILEVVTLGSYMLFLHSLFFCKSFLGT